MTREIIFVGDGSTFMINAITSNLTGAGYHVISVSPQIDSINEHKNDADIVVLYLDATVIRNTEVIVYLKDICDEYGKYLYIIGDIHEMKLCREIIPENIITAGFQRPLDIKKFVAKVDETTNNPKYHKSKQILLVDDDGDYLKMVSGWLSKKYRVVIVNSGMQAITYLATNKPDLILLDYAMPVTSGPQMLEMIRSEPGTDGIPVIFLTGKGDKESVMKVVGLKPDGYLLKSIGKDELLVELEKFFHGIRLL